MTLRMVLSAISLFAALGCTGAPVYGHGVEDIFPSEQAQALARAACAGDDDEVGRLIADGAAVDEAGRFQVTPLIWAITCDGIVFNDMVANRIAASGRPPAIVPPAPAYLAALESLLRAGANPNHMIHGDFGPVYPGGTGYWIDRYTPVLIAAEFRQAPVLQLLLRYGGDPNTRDGDNDHTALSLAHDRGYWLDLGPQMAPFDRRQWENFHALLDAGAQPGLDTGKGHNILERAAATNPGLVHEVLRRYDYDGGFDTIVWSTLFALDLQYPGEEERNRLLEFLRVEKQVDVAAAKAEFEAQKARSEALEMERAGG